MKSDADDGVTSPDREDLNSDFDDDDRMIDVTGENQVKSESNGSSEPTPNGQSKPSSKDPGRPRRKKARRACHACQRAHLTCGMFQ
jgi:hypothetical protein